MPFSTLGIQEFNSEVAEHIPDFMTGQISFVSYLDKLNLVSER